MRKILFALVATAILLFVPAMRVDASFVPDQNNKYGIHLAQPSEEDLKKAHELVNSQGGDWGYVTLVMQENDRDLGKWQGVFDLMRELHLIPIIRLASSPQSDVWRAPKPEDAAEWATFLNSLNWVVRARYITLFNEPNQSQEWGGNIDPAGYAVVAKAFAEKLKATSDDFVVMPAGFDASAPDSPPNYGDEEQFIRTMVDTITPEAFNTLFDAWSSHSYPNPGFAGPPSGFGRGSVRTYQWELDLLKSLGIKDLPVFITETGWDGDALNRDIVAQYTKLAYEAVWLPDPRVVAVTPFVLNYQGQPFTKFSWAKMGNSEYYPQFYMVRDLPKQTGNPQQRENGLARTELPDILSTGSIYRFPIMVKNTGESIWSRESGYTIKMNGADPHYYFIPDIPTIKPRQEAQLYMYAQTLDEQPGTKSASIRLYRNEVQILELKRWKFEVVPPPSLAFKINLLPNILSDGSDYELQLFDSQNQLIFKQTAITVKDGKGSIEAVPNIVLKRRYRVVLLRPHFLPRQAMVIFDRGMNEVSFSWMIPLDFNGDGQFDGSDVGTFFTAPNPSARV